MREGNSACPILSAVGQLANQMLPTRQVAVSLPLSARLAGASTSRYLFAMLRSWCAPLLGILVAGIAAAQPTPREVVLQATAAVEGDSVGQFRVRWERGLAVPGRRADALLALGTVARLTFQYRLAAQRYEALLAGSAPMAHGAYAALGLGAAEQTQARLPDAARHFRRADSLAILAADTGARLTALLGLARAVVNTEGDRVVDSLYGLAGPLVARAPTTSQALYRCGRAGPPLLAGELPEREEAAAGLTLARRSGDRRVVASCLMNLSRAHFRMGSLDSTIGRAREAAELQRQVRDRAALAGTLQWLGYVSQTRGDFGAAWRDLHQALAESAVAGAPAPRAQASLDLAAVALRFGDVGVAQRYAAVAESLYTEQGNARTLPTALRVAGDVARVRGDTAQARARYEKARASAERFGGFPMIAPYRSLATLSRSSGDWSLAERLLADARQAASGQGLGEWLQRVRYDEAALWLDQGDLDRAERGFQQYLATLSAAERGRGYAATVRLAEIAARRGQAETADRLLGEAQRDLEALRRGLSNPDLRAAVFQLRDDDTDPDLGFATILAALVDAGKAAVAFDHAERRRAREIRDQLIRAASLGSGSDPVLPGVPAGLSDSLSVARLVPILSQRKAALIAYQTGRRGEPTVAFVVSGAGVAGRNLAPIDSLISSVRTLIRSLESGLDAGAASARLGAALIEPLLALLPADVETLVIEPDLGLHGLPFAALRVGGQHLVERWSIGYTPAAAVLVNLWSRSENSAPARIASFGDPALALMGQGGSGVDPLRQAMVDAGAGRPLRGAREEAVWVSRYGRGGVVKLGSAASESALKKIRAGEFSIVHLATHAVVSEDAATRTALALAPGDGEDGLVGPGELARLSLGAEMIVLSACRTARGIALGGEGVRGFVSALLGSGTRAVMATSWRVEDRSTSVLVRRWYQAMARGLSVGGALQAMQVAALREGRPAAEWAAFAIVGDPTLDVRLKPR